MALVIAKTSGARLRNHVGTNVSRPQPIAVGVRVLARDRDNFGTVRRIDPNGTAIVHFWRNDGRGEAFVRLPLSILVPQ